MSTMAEILRAIQNQGEAFEAYQKTNDERLQAIKDGKDGLATDLEEKLGKINTDLTKWGDLKVALQQEVDFQRERIEILEARGNTPGKTAHEQVKDEYKGVFVEWIRAKGQSAALESQMQVLGKRANKEFKDITIGSDLGGGFAVPEDIATMIEKLELIFSPVRRLVKVVNTSTSDYKELVSLRGAGSGWVGESGSRAATATPTLRQRTPTHGELYAYPQVSEWALDDIFFNVDEWLASEVADEFALQEGQAVVDGSGTNRPTGMLNTTPTLGEDFGSPLRDADAYEYVASDTDLDASPSDPGVRGDSLLDLIYKLRSSYRARAVWVMNSTTIGSVRKLKDSNGQYHWQPGLAMGQPDRLLGYPIETWEQMPDIAAGAFPIGFGDWARAYVLVNRVGLRILRDPYSNPGFVRFYVRRREGGTVLNNDAAKFLRTID